MSFAIEVPGEAAPLTEGILIRVLQSASSSDPNQIQTGTKQLQQWERSPGFYKHLQSAYIDRRLPVEVRYLAVIQLKNGIDKYWRKTATNAISKEDKSEIRSRLIPSGLNEFDNRLALQNALVTAKILRYEYPADWPKFFAILIDTLRAASGSVSLPASRALLILIYAVKELSTGRLQQTRQALQAITPELVRVVGDLYASRVDAWHVAFAQGSQDAGVAEALQQSLLCLKVLRRLLVAFEFPNREQEAVELWRLSFQHLNSFLAFQQSTQANERVLLENHILQLAKLHHAMCVDHPAAFVLLPDSLQLVGAYWQLIKGFGDTFESSSLQFAKIGTDGDADDDKNYIEKVVLKGLLILRACIRMIFQPAHSMKYRVGQSKGEKQQATDMTRKLLFTPDFVQEIIETMITRYFVFQASDLREWEEEPEEWERREEGDSDSFEVRIRPCAEKLFLDLSINYKGTMLQPMIGLFRSVADANSNSGVLFKDSVYTAMGLAAPVVYEHFDFSGIILSSTLISEMQRRDQGYNILRRRIAILLGQWVSVSIPVHKLPLVYEIFQHLLDPADQLNDQVVRVTAGRQFKKIADMWEFEAGRFMPYAETTITRLMQLVEETELTETKMALLNTISVVVERLEHHIAPFAERILSLLPSLWEQSGDEHLMKQAILTMLTRLVNAMKADSVPFHDLIFPIIKGAVERGSESQVYLLEDALDLWSAIIIQTPAAPPELLSLLQYVWAVFETGSESLRKALEITESYLLLSPELILSDAVRQPLLEPLAALVGKLGAEANGQVCSLIEILIRSAEKLGGEAAVTQLATDLVQSGFLIKLLTGLRGSWTAHCTTGPLAQDPPVDGMIEDDHFAILARLILGSTAAACQAIQAAATPADHSSDLDSTMKWLLEEWFQQMDNISDPSRRKLMTLALTKLLQANQPFITNNLQLLMSTWTSVITELRGDTDETGDDGAVKDSLVFTRDAEGLRPAAGVPESPEEQRRRALTLTDPVHVFNLPAYVRHHLQQAIANAGSSFEQEWLANVDQDVVKAFGELGIM